MTKVKCKDSTTPLVALPINMGFNFTLLKNSSTNNIYIAGYEVIPVLHDFTEII